MTVTAREGRICAGCGNTVATGDNFCANCGVAFGASVPTTADRPGFVYLVGQGFAWGIGFFLAGLLLWIALLVLLGASLRASLPQT